jgi:hypothetical protein
MIGLHRRIRLVARLEQRLASDSPMIVSGTNDPREANFRLKGLHRLPQIAYISLNPLEKEKDETTIAQFRHAIASF